MTQYLLCQGDIVGVERVVPNESGFIIELDAEGARIRVRFSSDRALVIGFVVQLVAVYDQQ